MVWTYKHIKQLTKQYLLNSFDPLLITTDQSINRITTVSRREVEGIQMQAHLSQVRSSFEQLGDDEAIENKMHAIGRRSVALESKLMQLRRELQQDIEGSKDMVRNNVLFLHNVLFILFSMLLYPHTLNIETFTDNTHSLTPPLKTTRPVIK